MEEDNQEQQREQARNELLSRAGAYEETVRTKGWEHVRRFYKEQLASLVNNLILQGDKPITEFEAQRRELIGLQKLLSQVDSDLKYLEDYRKQAKPKKGEDERSKKDAT